MNPAAEQLTGFRLDEVQGKSLHYFVHHSHSNGTLYPMEECPIDRSLPTRAQERGEDVFVHKDGHFHPVAFTASPILENGNPVGTVLEVRDTTAEKEAERRIETERTLRAAVASRDEFLAVASHELRTPLTALSLHLERIRRLLAAAHVENPKLSNSIDVAVGQAERLEALIKGLLSVARISSGRFELHLECFDLCGLVRDVADRIAPVAASAGCALQLHLAEEVFGTWDRERLDEVLTNLFSNAVKYGPGVPIDVSLEADADFATFVIRDRGIGVPRELHLRIFDRYERGVTQANYGGLGLGLYIARNIVVAHGGEIVVESSPGEGAAFTVRLPRNAQPGASSFGDPELGEARP